MLFKLRLIPEELKCNRLEEVKGGKKKKTLIKLHRIDYVLKTKLFCQ